MQNKEEKTDIHIEIYIASLVMKRLGKMLNRTKTAHSGRYQSNQGGAYPKNKKSFNRGIKRRMGRGWYYLY